MRIYQLFFLAALALGGCAANTASESAADYIDWTVYKGDVHSTSYSALDQIDRTNVQDLRVAWTYETPDEPGPTIECNPIVVDGIMYVTSPRLKVIALDAATGDKLWVFDPFSEREASGVNRGVTYWSDGSDRRVLFTAGTYLYALDAETGEQISGFGTDGRVDLRKGLDRDSVGRVTASTPGIIYSDRLIMGSSVGEGPEHGAPGHIRAYDVRSGEREWIFHTIPHPGETGYDTWPRDAWKYVGGANSWAGMSLDRERGMVYVPTGSPTYDHFGGDRHGDNLFANTLLALDAATGERVWHRQLVHHDVWDYDLASPPTLTSIERDGRRIDVVAQPTKMGHLFVFNRETGEPIFPIEELPVPPSDLEGERLSPTQPFPPEGLRYARQGFGRRNVTERTREARAEVMNYVETYGESPLFPAPSTKGDIVLPQFNGGTDWGGAAVDPSSGILYVNASNVPEMLTMVEAPDGAEHPHPYVATGHQPIRDPDGYPISKPPWGTLNAIDLNEGKILWEVPLGEHPELIERGLPPTGTFNMGGPVATAGNVVFIGAGKDAKFRAFDAETGEVLWEHELPAGGYATPATYTVAGTQYVVIAAGGGGKPGTAPGNEYVAFSLPQ